MPVETPKKKALGDKIHGPRCVLHPIARRIVIDAERKYYAGEGGTREDLARIEAEAAAKYGYVDRFQKKPPPEKCGFEMPGGSIAAHIVARALLCDTKLNKSAKLIALLLLASLKQGQQTVCVSHAKLQARSGDSQSTVQRSLAELEKAKLIDGEGQTGFNRPNRYDLSGLLALCSEKPKHVWRLGDAWTDPNDDDDDVPF